MESTTRNWRADIDVQQLATTINRLPPKVSQKLMTDMMGSLTAALANAIHKLDNDHLSADGFLRVLLHDLEVLVSIPAGSNPHLLLFLVLLLDGVSELESS